MQQYLTNEAIIYSAKNEETREFEWNLPEYLPGIARIAKTDIQIEKCTFLREGMSAGLEIHLKFCIVYVSDFAGKLKNAFFRESVSIPFREPFDYEGDYTAIPSCYVSGVSSRPANNRKIHTKCTLFANAALVTQNKKELYDSGDNEHICTLTKTYDTHTRITLPEAFFEHETEIHLDESKPSVGDVIFVNATVSKCKAETNEGELDFECVMNLLALYEATDENNPEAVSYVTVSSPVTVKDTIRNDIISEGSEAVIYVDINTAEPSVSYDAYGENKSLSFNVKYSVSGFLYCREQKEIIEDAYSELYESSTETVLIPIDSIQERISKTERVSVPVRCDMGDMNTISECSAKILSVSLEHAEGKYFASAKCRLEVMGTNTSGELLCIDCPVSLHIPINESETQRSDTSPDVLLSIASCASSIKDGGLFCDFEVNVNGFTVSRIMCRAVETLNESKENSASKVHSEIIVYYPSKDDILWNIAKKYRVGKDAIMKANSLESEDISSRHIIIIP